MIKKKLLFTFLLISIVVCTKYCSRQEGIKNLHVTFDAGMQPEKHQHVFNETSQQWVFNFFKQLYEKNNLSKVAYQKEAKIPKIIHHVWLGGKMPKQYEGFYQSWLENHPDWTFIFWTDNDKNYDRGLLVKNFEELSEKLTQNTEKRLVVDTRKLVFDNKKFFDASRNYGQQSDILKWEIVYRFGGMYVDTDYECLKSLESLHHMYDFYTGLQSLDTNRVQLGAALYAAVPGHPILEHCVKTIASDLKTRRVIVDQTGPIHFTRSCLATVLKGDYKNIILPASYLYPCGYEQRGMPQKEWIKNESLAVHYWEGSWLKPEGFVKKVVA